MPHDEYVVLGWELEELEQATQGVRLLCDLACEGEPRTQGDAGLAPAAASAVATLVAERIKLVRRLVQGFAEPGSIAGSHNTVRAAAVPHEDVCWKRGRGRGPTCQDD